MPLPKSMYSFPSQSFAVAFLPEQSTAPNLP